MLFRSALLCLGGNPLTAWPDQIKTRAALADLDLLVVLDPKLTQTARYADYVFPPKLPPEIPTPTYDFEELETHAPGWGYPLPQPASPSAPALPTWRPNATNRHHPPLPPAPLVFSRRGVLVPAAPPPLQPASQPTR